MTVVLHKLSDAFETVVSSEVNERCSEIIMQRDAFEVALADLFVRFNPPVEFVKGPFRMANSQLILPSNDALRAAAERRDRQQPPMTCTGK